ncbi:MAG: 3-deoxy-D-manno-octulosonic acid kinase, partial [Steroidobacter sp.]
IINAIIEGNILYEPSLFDRPESQLFESGYWLSRNLATAVSVGRGQVLFIRDAGHQWVLRHYRRGGFIAKFNEDRYLWRNAEATRSFREWRLLAQLVELGLPVPVPVAARYVRELISYRADLITREITGARSLASLLKAEALSTTQWQLIGRTLARFHTFGVRHADLNAHNIVFDHEQIIHVLDFDRGQITKPDRQWIDRVLARLLRSLNKLKMQQGIHFADDDWQYLLQAHNAQFNHVNSNWDNQRSIP